MEVKPGYKQTEVGLIPEEWEVKSLSELASLYQPHTISAKQFTESGFPVYGANGVVGHYHSANHETWQVTVTCRGSTCGTVNRTVDCCWITGNAMVLNCDQNKRLNKEFFYHLMLGQDMSDCITGTGQPQIVRSPLAAFRVALPNKLHEQRSIAEALSDVDGLLGGLDRLIAKKRDLKQAAMQQLLTGQTRLPGFHGEWEVKLLGSIADILKGCALSKSLVTATGTRRCILYGELFTTYGRVISDVFGQTNSSEGCPSIQGDVLMPGSTTTTGIDLATASALLIDDVALGGDIIIIRRKSNAYDSVFLANYLTQVRRHEIAELTQGITIHHLYGKDLKTLTLQLPPLPEQTAIAEVLTEMDEELAALEKRREKTRALKQAMMQELLTGRIRLVGKN